MRLEEIPVGKIVNAHGVRGEVRVLPRDGDPACVARFRVFRIGGRRIMARSVRTHKGFALLKLPGVDTMDAALALKGQEVFVSRADGEIPAEAYFDDELPGMEVFDGASGTRLGVVTAVEQYPASRVYTVRGEKTYLIPAVPDAFILRVDLAANRMDVRVWEGLAQDED